MLSTIVDAVAGRRPDDVALLDHDRTWTYRELASTVTNVATGLLANGMRPGDRLCTFSPNVAELIITYFACFKAGIVLVPINIRFVGPEIEHVMKDSGATGLVWHHSLADQLPENSTQSAPSAIKHSWQIGGGSQDFSTLSSASNFGSELSVLPLGAPAAILYTSGTTSAPKGVVHSNSSLWNTAANQTWTQGFESTDVHLASLSVAHIAAFAGQVLTAVYAGGTIALCQSADAPTMLDALRLYRPTFVQLTPAFLAELIAAAEAATDGPLESVRCCLAGGDKVPPQTHDRFLKLTGVEVTEVCGMTESLSYLMNPPFGPKRAGSVGLASHGTRVAILGSDGQPVATGDTGEITVYSNQNMSGYWGNESATDLVLKDGWLHTGDYGRVDEDGWYYFEARRKFLIIRGGSNISPYEVEEALIEHPAVVEACVVGVPDAELGQRVAAAVVLHAGNAINAQQLQNDLSRRVSAYKVPETILICDDLPRTATGKLDRSLVERQVLSSLH